MIDEFGLIKQECKSPNILGQRKADAAESRIRISLTPNW